jgi:hypothetical protein
MNKKPHYLPALAYLALNRAVEPIDRALDPVGIFLVGSCLARSDYRDVDVRAVLHDEAYDRMFTHHQDVDAFWSLLCEGTSAYLERATGLPIDFQIQRMTDANAKHHGPRNALMATVGRGYPGELPSFIRERAKEGTP